MEKRIKLALGCGPRNYGDDWIHIDGGDYDHTDYTDITKLPCDDGSVDVIYASHVLEYFDRKEAMILLMEWKRALKPDGEIYISVPDFRRLAELYIVENCPLHRLVGPLYGHMKMNGMNISHKTVYDESSLGELLRFVGFERIEDYNEDDRCAIGVYIDDHSDAKIKSELISLNLRAIKKDERFK